MSNYDWVTDEMFDNKLEDILARHTGDGLLYIPGVYELVKEEFNNEVLQELEREREPEPVAKTILTIEVEYDPRVTDPESLAIAADHLLETALSTHGIVEEYGEPRFGEFFAPTEEDE